MQQKDVTHRRGKSFQRNVFVRVVLTASAISGVKRPIGVEEKNRKRKIAIELKKGQVKSIALH